jgi:hypothetical protein
MQNKKKLGLEGCEKRKTREMEEKAVEKIKRKEQ